MSKPVVRNLMIVVILIAIAAVIVAVILKHKKTLQIPLPAAVSINTTGQPTLGNPKAKLHIVAFEDLKCSHCMIYNTVTLPKIYAHYIKTGKAKYTPITLAFLPGSIPAANAARCIYKQNHHAFFDYVKYIYAHQPPEDENWATTSKLMLFATHIKGVNLDKLGDCLVQKPYTQTFTDNLSIAKKVMPTGVSTPSVYVNGVSVMPPTWAQFQKIVKHVE